MDVVSRRDVVIDSLDTLETLLRLNPDVKAIHGFDEEYRRALTYFQLKAEQQRRASSILSCKDFDKWA